MTPGLRMALSLLDGLLDELPGIIVMVTVNQVWGGILWVAAQPVVLPMMTLIIIDWIRHDRTEAREVDSALDSIEAAGGSTSTPWCITHPSGDESGSGDPEAPHRPGDLLLLIGPAGRFASSRG